MSARKSRLKTKFTINGTAIASKVPLSKLGARALQTIRRIPFPDLWNSKQLARALGCHRRTVHEWVDHPDFRPVVTFQGHTGYLFAAPRTITAYVKQNS